MSHPLYQVSQYTEYILLYILYNHTHPAPHIPHAPLPLSTTLLTPLCTYHSGDSFLSLLALDSPFLLFQSGPTLYFQTKTDFKQLRCTTQYKYFSRFDPSSSFSFPVSFPLSDDMLIFVATSRWLWIRRSGRGWLNLMTPSTPDESLDNALHRKLRLFNVGSLPHL